MKDSHEPRSAERLAHPFAPLFSAGSEVLILGSFPSVRSRAEQFYYGHPLNRFWQVIAGVFQQPLPLTVADKKALILSRHLALWDAVASCGITGSSDASIQAVVPNDLRPILAACPIRLICCNGRKAYEIYQRRICPETGVQAVCLPSTSPANARFSLPQLLDAWAVIRQTQQTQ